MADALIDIHIVEIDSNTYQVTLAAQYNYAYSDITARLRTKT